MRSSSSSRVLKKCSRGIDIGILTYYHAPDSSEGSDRVRGPDEQTSGMFSYLSPEQRVRADHPLRAVRRMTDQVFAALSPRFTQMYSTIGRPSIPPEQLLRALLLQYLYTVRSERLLMEEIDYSVLYRWFVGLSMDDPIWSPTTFSKNRDRLLEGDIAGRSLMGSWDRRAPLVCSRTNTSPWMAPCSKPGRVSKASGVR